MDDRISISDKGMVFSLSHRVKTGYKAHPTSYPMGTVVPFRRGKSAEA